MRWDAFICHASEDKDSFVRPLASELLNKGLSVWFDEFSLQVGDSLRRTIDKGLAESNYGVVVLSPDFFRKDWPQRELDGLAAREIGERKVILPIWRNVTHDVVARYSPTLADRYAIKTEIPLSQIVEELLKVIRPEVNAELIPATEPADSEKDRSWRDSLQPLTLGNLISFAHTKESGIDWNTYILGPYEQMRQLHIVTMAQLVEAIENDWARTELHEVYGRLLGRKADWIGIFIYQPVIFLMGQYGKVLVEQAVISSPEYRERKAKLASGPPPAETSA